MPIQTLPENPQFVIDTDRGIVIPTKLADIVYSHPHDDPNRVMVRSNKIVRHVPGLGTQLAFDDETGVAFWPAYASGLDDFLMAALVNGYMISGGPTPVWISMLSTLVAKLQLMAGTWVVTVRGKQSPVGKFLDVLSQADDGYGSSLFVQNLIGALNVHNRGAIISQVPIAEIGFDKWAEYGMIAEPMPKSPTVTRNRKKIPERYILTMTPDKFRENRGLWTVDGLTCLPTGDPQYPYYIKKHSPELRTDVWVLIPKEFGFQMLQNSGPKNSLYAGFGQSGAWRFSPYVVRYMAIDRMDWEHLVNQPPRGIVWASGLDTPTQFRDQLVMYRQEREEKKQAFYPGVFFGGSKGENSKVTMHPWMEPPVGYTPDKWISELISGLAACFHVNETHLRLRLGEGALTQSAVADSLEAETAIAWMRQQVELALNFIAPPRVYIMVAFKSDRQNRILVETLREFSLFVSRLQGKPTTPDYFSVSEVRAMSQALGLEIPITDGVETSITDENTSDDIPEDEATQQTNEEIQQRVDIYCRYAIADLEARDRTIFRAGNFVVYQNRLARIREWSGRNNWIWLRIDGSRWDILADASQVYLLPFSLIGYAPVKNAFVPEGDPAPLSESDAEIDDPDAAADDANQLWLALMDNDVLTAWEWDEDGHEYSDGETIADHQTLISWRDSFSVEAATTYTNWSPSDEGKDRDDLSLVGLLLLRHISLSEWEEEMRIAIQDTIVSQYALGRGGFSQLTDEDWLAIESILFPQLQRLNIFSTEIALGLLTEGQIRARAELYFLASVLAFEIGRAHSYSYDLVLPCYPGDGSSECRARDRCFWQIVDLGDTIEATWVRTAVESCTTCVSRGECSPIVFDKATGDLFGADCYII